MLNGLFSKSIFLSTALVSCLAPLVSKNLRLISTIFLPFKYITSLLVSVIVATFVASIFSLLASFIKLSASLLSTTTAILSCDSDIASSVPFNPKYLTGKTSRLMSIPSDNSPMATETPPAPKSLHFFINFVTSLFLNSL